MSNIVRGTMLLTIATFLSKFLGMIYVIPFNELVGETGGTLFQFAYTPYNILISISTVGVPLAVSKFVSKYNALGDYYTGMRMFKAGMVLMLGTGFLAFLMMYFGADLLASQIISTKESDGIAVADIAMVMRMVSFALIVIPAMSIVRGFFQGYESMGPTAVSQVVEQIVRIIFLLTAAFLIMNVYNGTIATAVGFATFAAFIGALASCVILALYWFKRKNHLNTLVESQTKTYTISTKDLFIELFTYAGPFIIVGLATPLYQLIDQFTFERAMVGAGLKDLWVVSFGTINFYGHKLVIIPVTIATGLSLAILPALTKSFTNRETTVMNKQINQALQIVLVLVIPAVVGLIALSDVAYGSLFGLGNIEISGPLLAWSAPLSILFGTFIVSSSILQGINEQRFAVVSLSAGLLFKLLLNTQFIHMFGAKGAIFGTMSAVGIASICNLWRIKKSIQFSYRETAKRGILVLLFSGVMFAAIMGVKYVSSFFFAYQEQRVAAVIVLLLGVGIGGIVYLWLAYQSTLLERTLGSRVSKLERFIKKI